MTAREIPTPIPAFALVLNPEDVAATVGLEVALVVVAVEEVVLVSNMEVEVVDGTLVPDVVVEGSESRPAAFVRLK